MVQALSSAWGVENSGGGGRTKEVITHTTREAVRSCMSSAEWQTTFITHFLLACFVSSLHRRVFPFFLANHAAGDDVRYAFAAAHIPRPLLQRSAVHGPQQRRRQCSSQARGDGREITTASVRRVEASPAHHVL